MRPSGRVLIVCGCLVLAGCSTLGKKPAANTQAQGTRPADPTPSVPGPPAPAMSNSVGALLAGQVVDTNNRKLGSIQIQVVDNPDPNAAPIEVAADANGYFVIQGVQAGKPYRLTARATYGDRIVMGSTWATPPDPRVVIRIVDDFPAPPIGMQRTVAPPASHGRPAELGPPTTMREQPAPAPKAENIATTTPTEVAGTTIDIKGPKTAAEEKPAPSPPPIPTADTQGTLTTGPARVPSCVLTGQQLHNFALNDVNGQPWEFKQHRGKLILIDFWGSWCVPCLQAIPHLRMMQERYGPFGLEVIGIAYEDGTPDEQIQKVRRVQQRLGVNYRLLMGGDRARCPVRTQFGVRSYPTLFLLDDTGRILWRSEGLDAQHARELEILVKQRLGVR